MRVGWNLVSLTIVLASVATAQERPAFGMATGFALPAGTFRSGNHGEGFNKALTPVLTLRIPLRRQIATRVDLVYSRHGANDSLAATLSALVSPSTKEHASLLGANVAVVLAGPAVGRLKPYVLGGSGLFRSAIALVTPNRSGSWSSRIGMAWNLGVGTYLRVGKKALWLEGRRIGAGSPGGLPRITVTQILLGLQFASP